MITVSIENRSCVGDAGLDTCVNFFMLFRLPDFNHTDCFQVEAMLISLIDFTMRYPCLEFHWKLAAAANPRLCSIWCNEGHKLQHELPKPGSSRSADGNFRGKWL